MPQIVLSSEAMAKWLFVRDSCNPETLDPKDKTAGKGFLECSLLGESEAEYLPYIKKLHIPKQEVSAGTTELDDDWLADYSDRMIEEHNIPGKQCSRVWLHTHPGSSASPSSTDNETWNKHYGQRDWAAMLIIARSRAENAVNSPAYYGRAKYDSLFGIQDNECEVLFELAGRVVPVSFIFDATALCSKHSISVHKLLFDDFTPLHKEWVAEMRENVSEKVYSASHHNTGSYSNGSYTGGHHQHQHNQDKKKETVGAEQKLVTTTASATGGTGDQDKKKRAIGFQNQSGITSNDSKLNCSDLIRIFIQNKVATINAFGHKEIIELAKEHKISQADLHALYLRIRTNENTMTLDVVDDMLKDNSNLIVNLQSNVDGLTEDQKIDICTKYGVRIQFLGELVASYLKQSESAI